MLPPSSDGRLCWQALDEALKAAGRHADAGARRETAADAIRRAMPGRGMAQATPFPAGKRYCRRPAMIS